MTDSLHEWMATQFCFYLLHLPRSSCVKVWKHDCFRSVAWSLWIILRLSTHHSLVFPIRLVKRSLYSMICSKQIIPPNLIVVLAVNLGFPSITVPKTTNCLPFSSKSSWLKSSKNGPGSTSWYSMCELSKIRKSVL